MAKAFVDKAPVDRAPVDRAPIDKASADNAPTENAHLNNSADTVTLSLRKTGFRLMLGFSLVIIVVIAVARPDNIVVALGIGIDFAFRLLKKYIFK